MSDCDYERLRESVCQYAVESLRRGGDDSGVVGLLMFVKDAVVTEKYGKINPSQKQLDALLNDDEGETQTVIYPGEKAEKAT
jgi:hypothetical protein